MTAKIHLVESGLQMMIFLSKRTGTSYMISFRKTRGYELTALNCRQANGASYFISCQEHNNDEIPSMFTYISTFQLV